MLTKPYLACCCLGLWIFSGLSWATDNEEDLSSLSVEDLLAIELSLDETFDIFGALVSPQNVSVASGKQQDAFSAPAVTTVITAQDIEATGARTLMEALQAVPGLHIGRNNLYEPVTAMRGLNSSGSSPHLQFLVNGQPIYRVSNGNRGIGWRDMPVNNIARIEIIRGPGSALYGADAFAGTVNILTKTAQDIHGSEGGVRAGSFDTYEAWALHGEQHENYQVAASFEYTETQGADVSVQRDAQTQTDALFGNQLSKAPGYLRLQENMAQASFDVSNKNWRGRLSYQGRDGGSVLGSGGGLNDWGDYEQENFAADLIYENPVLGRNWQLKTELNYVYSMTNSQIEAAPEGFTVPVDIGGGQIVPFVYTGGIRGILKTVEQQMHLGTSALYSGFENHLVRMGLGLRAEDLSELSLLANNGLGPDGQQIVPGSPFVDLSDTSAASLPEETRKSYYAYAQDTWTLHPQWELTWGLRYDHYSDFGDTVNPRVALVWKATPTLSAKALFGRAFRAPSFRELYLVNTPLFLGNPDLEPETIETAELAFNWRARSDLNLGLNIYAYKVNDLIQTVKAETNVVPIAQNAGSVDGRGIELESRWKMDARTSLMFNFALMDTEYSHDDNDALLYSDTHGLPQQKAYLRLDRLIAQRWYLNTELSWFGKQKRINAQDTRDPIQDTWNINLTLRYKDPQNSPWNVAFGVRNLLDEDLVSQTQAIVAPDGIPLAGRSYFFELRYRF